MDVCRAHYVKGFAIWIGSEVIYGEFTTGYLLSVFTNFLDELRKQNALMTKGEIASGLKEKFKESVVICDSQPNLCDTFQF